MIPLMYVGRRWLFPSLLLAVTGGLVSCAVGPDYKRPELKTPVGYKRAVEAEKAEPTLASNWWTLFNDPALTALVDEAVGANYDIYAAMARVDQARASTRSSAGNFFPAIDFNPSVQRNGNATTTSTLYRAPVSLGYELDVWGRLRRAYESSKNTELATAADLETVRQTVAANVAQSYFTIRFYDRQIAIFEEALRLYNQQLGLTDTKYKAGLALQTDLLQAKTQVNNATNQLIEVRRSRAKEEHSIAILLGRNPSDYSIEKAPLSTAIPVVPAGIPIELLSRRPDVYASEHRLIAANAQIGVATANFFPNFSLSGSAGFQTNNIDNLFKWSSRVWSITPSASLPIFQGGQLTAALAQTKARYQELVAGYRSTVLLAFADVEDQLSDLHLLAEKTESLEATLTSAREYSRLTEVQYKQGLTTYLQVIDANQNLLNNEISAAQAHLQRLNATVLLIRALGGGWDGVVKDEPKK
jgi:multidrug efflux system outer membrane protein